MLRRLGSGVALASVAALMLVGCTPDEPVENDTADLVETTFSGFYATVDAQFAAGTASETELARYATEELARAWATDIQAVLDSGTSSRGVLLLTAVDVTSESPEEVRATLCTDGREIETINADGATRAPSERVAWNAVFLRTEPDSLLLDNLEPSADSAICGA